jgi:hypothetical protein
MRFSFIRSQRQGEVGREACSYHADVGLDRIGG